MAIVLLLWICIVDESPSFSTLSWAYPGTEPPLICRNSRTLEPFKVLIKQVTKEKRNNWNSTISSLYAHRKGNALSSVPLHKSHLCIISLLAFCWDWAITYLSYLYSLWHQCFRGEVRSKSMKHSALHNTNFWDVKATRPPLSLKK